MTEIYTEPRIKIHLHSDDKKKIYTLDVPSASTLAEVYDIASKFREKFWKQLEEDKKVKDNKESCKDGCKTALHEKREVPKETVVQKQESTKKDLKETILGKN